jgi:GNAT superfamily N-acetyltransferase
MDETRVLPYCLHGGPIPVSDLVHPEEARARIEAEKGLPHGPIVEFLRAISRVYGASGVMAVDGDAVIGKLRFAPWGGFLSPGHGCVQSEAEVNSIGALDLGKLTPKEELSPKSLFIWCFQVVPAYGGQGIGTNMLVTAIDWARENGWEEIQALAVRHIRPLLDWAGSESIDRLRRLGFREVGHSVNDELKKGVVAMRGGYHGEDVRRQWEPYANLSDDEASWIYDVVLNFPKE